MASLIPGFEYDIFISYRQKDNKGDKWVSEFVNALKTEIESTFKEEISIYFDENPKDGLLETHIVDESLIKKLKCLVFIPVISQTYCDSNSYAWNHEFCVFNKLAKEDRFGRDISLTSGNLSSRILPVKIHELEPEDKALLENEIGSFLRSIEFIYKSAGVNRPLRANEEHPQDNLNKTYYRDQINKVANAVKEIITALKRQSQHPEEMTSQNFEAKPAHQKNQKAKIIIASLILLALIVAGYFIIPKIFKSSGQIEKSIAVLPFNNLSNDPEQEYFSDGMVEAILDNLFKVGGLKVISSTSTKRYRNTTKSLKEIAHELDVSSILEGSVQKIGNNVRITTQLIDTKTDSHLWSEKYDKDLSDVFSIYSEVAQSVSKALKVTLTAQETIQIQKAPSTNNQLAYDFYLKGKDYFSRYETDLALEMFSKAIQEDSLFTAAYAQRAKIHFYIFWNKNKGWQDHNLSGTNDIKKGLKLDPESSEIKFAQAVGYYHIDRDYDKALEILNELKTFTPSVADVFAYIGFILRRQGRLEESVIELKRAIQLDPFNANYRDNLSLTFQLLHQYDNQIECASQGLLLIPEYKRFNDNIFSAVIDKTGDLKEALNRSRLMEDQVWYGTFSSNREVIKDVTRYGIYYYNRQFEKLIELIYTDTVIKDNQTTYRPKAFELALAYYLKGITSLSNIYADSAIIHLKEKIKEMPDDDRFYATLGKCYAFIGNINEAIACGQKAVDLKPIKLDTYQGAAKEQDLMEIYIFTGKYDLALDKIEYLLSAPSWLSTGDLLIDPIFDKLRNLPRFQKILKTDYKN